MAQRISILRIVGAIAAVTLISGAIAFMIGYRRTDREFWEWVNARPMTASVDLSQPGVFTAPFHQMRQGGHGEVFHLTVNPTTATGNLDLLHGLDVTITIKDSGGKKVQSLEIGSTTVTSASSDNRWLLGEMPPLPLGEYSAIVQVKKGAPALRGIEQNIHAQHDHCGCENLAFVNAILAWALGIPGVVIGLHVSYGFVKHGWKTPPKRMASRWLRG